MPSEDDDSTCRLTTAPSRPLRRPRTAAVLTLLRTRCRLRHQGADRTRPCPHHLNEVDAALLRARMMEIIMLLTSIAVSRVRHSAKRGKSPAPVQLAIPLSHHVFRSGLVPLQLLPCRSMKAMKTRCIPCCRKMSSKGPGSFAHGGHLSFPRNFSSSAAFGLVTLSPRSLLIAGGGLGQGQSTICSFTGLGLHPPKIRDKAGFSAFTTSRLRLPPGVLITLLAPDLARPYKTEGLMISQTGNCLDSGQGRRPVSRPSFVVKQEHRLNPCLATLCTESPKPQSGVCN